MTTTIKLQTPIVYCKDSAISSIDELALNKTTINSVEVLQVTGLTSADISILQKNVDMILSLCDSLGALQTAITNTNHKLKTGINSAGTVSAIVINQYVDAIGQYADKLGRQMSCMACAIEQLQPKYNPTTRWL